MPKFSLNPFSKGGLPSQIFNKSKNFVVGDEGYQEQRSRLTPEQQKIQADYESAINGPGANGAFGTSADYYRDLLSNDSQTMNQLNGPEMRRFNEQTIPGLSEQFAGMGSGGLDSSGFRNAAVGAGTDLSERLGAIRANLRSQGAAGLSNLAQGALNPVVENIEVPGQPGLIDFAGPALAAAGTAFAGPGGGTAGLAAGQGISNMFSNKGKASPYGAKANIPYRGAMSNNAAPNTYNSSPFLNTMQGMR